MDTPEFKKQRENLELIKKLAQVIEKCESQLNAAQKIISLLPQTHGISKCHEGIQDVRQLAICTLNENGL